MAIKQHIFILANESMKTRYLLTANLSFCQIICDTLVKYCLGGFSFITEERFLTEIWIGLFKLRQKILGSYRIIQEVLKSTSHHLSQKLYHNTNPALFFVIERWLLLWDDPVFPQNSCQSPNSHQYTSECDLYLEMPIKR